jgi:hypothetical protein
MELESVEGWNWNRWKEGIGIGKRKELELVEGRNCNWNEFLIWLVERKWMEGNYY